MKVYLFIILWIAFIGFVSKGSEITETINGYEEKRTNYTYAILMFSVIIIFTGLRSSVGDTVNYINSFKRLDIEGMSLLSVFGESDGYQLFHAYGYVVKKYVSEDPTVYLFGIALISGTCAMIGFRRCSSDYCFSLILFMLAGKFTWMMNGIKQFAAVALVFMALKYITEDKKTYKFFIYIFIAYLIHPTAIIMLPAYFIVKSKPWSLKVLLTVALSLLAVTFVSDFTSLLEFLTEDTVFETDFAVFADDDGANIMRFFVSLVPPVLALLKRKEVEAKATPMINVMINMSVISACTYLIATFSSGILIGRLPIYFELTGYALIPWLLDNVYGERDGKLLRVLCIAFYCIFFYFQVWGLEYTSSVLGLYLY